MEEEERKKVVERVEDKQIKLKHQRKVLRLLVGGGLACIAMAIGLFIIANKINPSNNKDNSFYVYYADCRVCKRDLPKLNKDGKYPNYEFTSDKAKIVNEIGFGNYEKITSHRVPVKVIIDGDKIKYEDNPLK